MLSCFLTLLWKNSFGLENDQFYPEGICLCKTVGKRVKSELWYTCSFAAFFCFWLKKRAFCFNLKQLYLKVFSTSLQTYKAYSWRKNSISPFSDTFNSNFEPNSAHPFLHQEKFLLYFAIDIAMYSTSSNTKYFAVDLGDWRISLLIA